MKHQVAPLDAYPDSWRCSCNEIFRSDSGFAICPNAIVKGFVRRFNSQWFYYVRIDTAVLYQGNTGSWRESFDRAYRHVTAIRPVPQSAMPTWPNHSASSTI